MAPPKGRHRDQVDDCSDSSLRALSDKGVVLAAKKNLELSLVPVLKNDGGTTTGLLLQAVGFLALLGADCTLFIAQARPASTAIGAGHNCAVFAC